MGSRGRDRLITCTSCGRTLPRGKAVSYERRVVFSTDLRTADDVKYFDTREEHYCPSCGKSKGIYEKKKRQAMQKYNTRPA
ncbi:MAG: hypothetical protein Q7T16_05835 [Candidatus Burarchaeum sp.]|nr:hypothetical protein [Candidatus Burarchaeum sp.]MDO8340147.1 hypothetical protein [Candidatus Burarchaeum sp.]